MDDETNTDTLTYPVARDFKHGLRCAECHRVIPEGGPYARRLEGFAGGEGGEPISLIVCVYCSMEPQP